MDYLISLHDKIKFTIQVELDNRLSFLDVVVKRKTDGGFTTNIYRKKTFKGTYLNWKSLTIKSYKLGLITCLLDRAC